MNIFKFVMSKWKKHKNHSDQVRVINIDKSKLYINSLNKDNTEIAIEANCGNVIFRLCYKDSDSEYLINDVKDIIDRIQD